MMTKKQQTSNLLVSIALLFSILGLIFSNNIVPDKVIENTQDIQELNKYIKSQKICSDSNQKACVDLFQRLSDNITEAQRKELACAVLAELDQQAVKQLENGSNCPK